MWFRVKIFLVSLFLLMLPIYLFFKISGVGNMPFAGFGIVIFCMFEIQSILEFLLSFYGDIQESITHFGRCYWFKNIQEEAGYGFKKEYLDNEIKFRTQGKV